MGSDPITVGQFSSDYPKMMAAMLITKDVYYSKLYEKTMLRMSDKKQIGLLEIIKKDAESALQAPV